MAAGDNKKVPAAVAANLCPLRRTLALSPPPDVEPHTTIHPTHCILAPPSASAAIDHPDVKLHSLALTSKDIIIDIALLHITHFVAHSRAPSSTPPVSTNTRTIYPIPLRTLVLYLE
ncbi:hypothetical protein PNOK_0580900 [Pyrrhoderma noxium]|uniref:Uncharacterized protein n=1 Tax=Pyrrhoderma noxium TaxID=2282107 RepID=A0A286UHM8_9AGAM|nr:hypothetical protein PNOK_0580900 [Pyrrhoderma noxium]